MANSPLPGGTIGLFLTRTAAVGNPEISVPRGNIRFSVAHSWRICRSRLPPTNTSWVAFASHMHVHQNYLLLLTAVVLCVLYQRLETLKRKKGVTLSQHICVVNSRGAQEESFGSPISRRRVHTSQTFFTCNLVGLSCHILSSYRTASTGLSGRTGGRGPLSRSISGSCGSRGATTTFRWATSASGD